MQSEWKIVATTERCSTMFDIVWNCSFWIWSVHLIWSIFSKSNVFFYVFLQWSQFSSIPRANLFMLACAAQLCILACWGPQKLIAVAKLAHKSLGRLNSVLGQSSTLSLQSQSSWKLGDSWGLPWYWGSKQKLSVRFEPCRVPEIIGTMAGQTDES